MNPKVSSSKWLSVLALLVGVAVMTSASFAAEETSWGQLKQTVISDSAAKRIKTDKTKPTRVTSAISTTSATSDASTVPEPIATTSALVKVSKRKALYAANFYGEGKADDVQVWLTIPQGALTENTTITMTLYGPNLSDLVIAFAPGGLVFQEPAELIVLLGQDHVDTATTELQVLHQYSDGTVEDATLISSQSIRDDYFEFRTEVPGFSRYSVARY